MSKVGTQMSSNITPWRTRVNRPLSIEARHRFGMSLRVTLRGTRVCSLTSGQRLDSISPPQWPTPVPAARCCAGCRGGTSCIASPSSSFSLSY
eukprot:1362163-Amorphochlora_amoeboformis.AAC.1